MVHSLAEGREELVLVVHHVRGGRPLRPLRLDGGPRLLPLLLHGDTALTGLRAGGRKALGALAARGLPDDVPVVHGQEVLDLLLRRRRTSRRIR